MALLASFKAMVCVRWDVRLETRGSRVPTVPRIEPSWDLIDLGFGIAFSSWREAKEEPRGFQACKPGPLSLPLPERVLLLWGLQRRIREQRRAFAVAVPEGNSLNESK